MTFTDHSPGHNKGQYPDGFRGPVLIHDPNFPYHYDDELALTLSDWYHDQMPVLIPYYLSTTQNPDGSEPIPKSGLLNDNATTSFSVEPGKTYLVRIICMTNLAAWYLHFDQHEMTVVEVDGVYTEQQTTDQIYLSSGQRYSVLITTKNTATKNYAFVGAMDPNMFDGGVPSYLNPNATGYLMYNTKAALPPQPVIPTFAPLNDASLVPYDKMPLLGPVDHQIIFNVVFGTGFHQNR